MAEVRPGLQELIDLFDIASRQKEDPKYLKKLHDDGAKWYGELFTARVRSIDKALEKQEKTLRARRPKGVPAADYQKYVEDTLRKHGQILKEEFPSGVFIKGNKADEAKLAEVRRHAPVLVPLVAGEVAESGTPAVSTGRLGHLRVDYVLRKFAELNQNVPKGATENLGVEDARAAYRYALAWLIRKQEPSVVADMKLLAETAGLSGKVAVSNVGEKWIGFFGDLAAVTHWALNDSSGFLVAQTGEAKRRAKVRAALLEEPKLPEEAKIHFGQHLGKPLSDLPLTYLLWVQDLVPAAQTFMKALAGPAPDAVRVPEKAKNPYFAGKRGDGLEQAVGRRVQDLDEKTRARVVRFMETAANDIFARRLRTFTETPMFREAEAKYVGFLSEREQMGVDVAGNRRLRDGSVKDWYGRGVQEADVGQKEFAFREPAPGLSVRAARSARLPSMEEAERRRTLGLKGFRTPLPVQSEMLKVRSEEAEVNVEEIKKADKAGSAGVVVWDMMLRWEEKIEETNRPDDLEKLLRDIKETVRRLPGLIDHEYYDVILSAWSEKMNAVRGKAGLAAGRRAVRRQGLSREEIRGLGSYQPPGND
jgi:hypothetical protein